MTNTNTESNNTPIMDIGLNIKACLDIHEKTYKWLSEESGISAPTLFGFAEGEGLIEPEQVEKLATVLEISESFLTKGYTDGHRHFELRKAMQAHTVIVDSDDILSPGEDYPDWWRTGGNGRIPLWAIAPDPDQPRQYMDPEELAALTTSVRERGIRQSLTLTPVESAPWVNYDKEGYPHALFINVSGHRRTEAGLMAKVADAPAEVKLYSNQTEHLIDGSLLNDLQAKLTPLEQGYELKRLLLTVRVGQLSKIRGMSVPTIYGRLALTKLDPWIQKFRLHPKHIDQSVPKLTLKVAERLGSICAPDSEQLPKTVKKLGLSLPSNLKGGEESNLFMLQNLLLRKIENDRMGSVAACDFIDRAVGLKPAVLDGHLGKKTIRRAKDPNQMRDRVSNTLRGMSSASIFAWEDADFKRAFEGVRKDQVADYLADAKSAQDSLQRLISRLRKKMEET